MPTCLQILWGKLTTSMSPILLPVAQMFLTLTSVEPTADHSSASADPVGSQELCRYTRTFNHRQSELRSRSPNRAGWEDVAEWLTDTKNSPSRSWTRESTKMWG